MNALKTFGKSWAALSAAILGTVAQVASHHVDAYTLAVLWLAVPGVYFAPAITKASSSSSSSTGPTP